MMCNLNSHFTKLKRKSNFYTNRSDWVKIFMLRTHASSLLYSKYCFYHYNYYDHDYCYHHLLLLLILLLLLLSLLLLLLNNAPVYTVFAGGKFWRIFTKNDGFCQILPRTLVQISFGVVIDRAMECAESYCKVHFFVGSKGQGYQGHFNASFGRILPVIANFWKEQSFGYPQFWYPIMCWDSEIIHITFVFLSGQKI